MGKSSHNYDKGAPRHKVKNDEEEEFDWREELRKQKIEEDKAKEEDWNEEIHHSLEEHELNKKLDDDNDFNEKD